MKNTLLSCYLLLFTFSLLGQAELKSISFAYFGQFAIEPGIKASAELAIKEISATRKLVVSPQIGFFVRPNNNSNLLFNADIGIKKQKEGKSNFSAFSLGLGYLHQFQISAIAIQLGDGSQATSSSSKAYFLPTINYAFGNKLGENLGWYSKIGVGQRLGGGISSSSTVLLEIGVQLHL